ncbi:MAG: phosphatidylglycerol lysyltransferase domain-containing protein [Syntrophales bacterium]
MQKWRELRRWDADKGERLTCERMATMNAFNHADALEVKGILVHIDGVVCAFGISSRLTDTVGVLNFEKANASTRGLYQFLDNECAKRLSTGNDRITMVKSYRLALHEK